MEPSPSSSSRRRQPGNHTRSITPSYSSIPTTKSGLTASLTLTLLASSCLLPLASADLARKHLAIRPADRFASPKFDVRIWNHLPIRKKEAEEWLAGNWGERSVRGEPGEEEERRGEAGGKEEWWMEAFRGEPQNRVDSFFKDSTKMIEGSPENNFHSQKQFKTQSQSGEPALAFALSKASRKQPSLVRLKLPSTSSSGSLSNNTNKISTATDDYLCLLPDTQNSPQSNLVDQEGEGGGKVLDPPNPQEAWDALSHLKGHCLFHRQGWFTYRYCHDSHIRQFRESAHPHPHPPSGFLPTEDTAYDGFTLGLSPSEVHRRSSSLNTPSSSSTYVPSVPADVTINVNPSPITPQNRYISLYWSDGTTCDKTQLPRSTEIQFHCSPTGVDQISFIKEIATCEYLMVITSPRVCGLPGFRVKEEDEDESRAITCRQILDTDMDITEESGDGDKRWEEALNERRKRIEGRERFFLSGGTGTGGTTSTTTELDTKEVKGFEKLLEGRLKTVYEKGDRFPLGYQYSLPTIDVNEPEYEQEQEQEQEQERDKHSYSEAEAVLEADRNGNRHAYGDTNRQKEYTGDDKETDIEMDIIQLEVMMIDEHGNEIPLPLSETTINPESASDADADAEADADLIARAESALRAILRDFDKNEAFPDVDADVDVDVDAADPRSNGGIGVDMDADGWLNKIVQKVVGEIHERERGTTGRGETRNEVVVEMGVGRKNEQQKKKSGAAEMEKKKKKKKVRKIEERK